MEKLVLALTGAVTIGGSVLYLFGVRLDDTLRAEGIVDPSHYE